MHAVTRDFHAAEIRMRQADHHAANTAVLDQQIGAATQHHEGNSVFTADFEHRRQFRFRRGFNVKIRRTADAQGGFLRQRFVLAQNRRRRKRPGQRRQKLFCAARHRFAQPRRKFVRGSGNVAGAEKQHQVARLHRRAHGAGQIIQPPDKFDRSAPGAHGFGEPRAVDAGNFRLVRGIDFRQPEFVRVAETSREFFRNRHHWNRAAQGKKIRKFA